MQDRRGVQAQIGEAAEQCGVVSSARHLGKFPHRYSPYRSRVTSGEPFQALDDVVRHITQIQRLMSHTACKQLANCLDTIPQRVGIRKSTVGRRVQWAN